jgi:hypothetical protein
MKLRNDVLGFRDRFTAEANMEIYAHGLICYELARYCCLATRILILVLDPATCPNVRVEMTWT